MSIEYFWRLPTHGDGTKAHDKHTRGEWNKTPVDRRVAPRIKKGVRDPFSYIDYLSQVARAAEISGFDGVLVPTGAVSEQSWIVSAALARETKTLRFMVAHQPAYTEPHFTVQMAATLQRITNNRVDLNIITGGDSAAQRKIGDFLDHDARYARTGEFLDVFRGYWENAPFTYEGDHYGVQEGGLTAPLKEAAVPAIYFAGASGPAIDVAARHADIYLMWAEPLAGNLDVIRRVRQAAEAAGRGDKVKFGIRIDIIAGATEEEAWEEARSLFRTATEETRERSSTAGGLVAGKVNTESEGAKRQWALHKGNAEDFDALIIGPNLWAGMSFLRGGPSCGLIGSYEQIAERLAEYVNIGASMFILASNPHLEQAYRIGEEVLPLMDEAIARVAGASTPQPQRSAA